MRVLVRQGKQCPRNRCPAIAIINKKNLLNGLFVFYDGSFMTHNRQQLQLHLKETSCNTSAPFSDPFKQFAVPFEMSHLCWTFRYLTPPIEMIRCWS